MFSSLADLDQYSQRKSSYLDPSIQSAPFNRAETGTNSSLVKGSPLDGRRTSNYSKVGTGPPLQIRTCELTQGLDHVEGDDCTTANRHFDKSAGLAQRFTALCRWLTKLYGTANANHLLERERLAGSQIMLTIFNGDAPVLKVEIVPALGLQLVMVKVAA